MLKLAQLRRALTFESLFQTRDKRPPAEPPICADTGAAKWPGNCWNVRCQLGGTCCRAAPHGVREDGNG
jgi:hypothetical protein